MYMYSVRNKSPVFKMYLRKSAKVSASKCTKTNYSNYCH